MVSHGHYLDQWPLTGASGIKTLSWYHHHGHLAPRLPSFPRCPRVTDVTMIIRCEVLVLVSALCTGISSRRQSVPIWIRSRPGISFCNVFATRSALQNTTILAIYDLGMRYHYPGQVNKIELGNRGCRKYAQPKQSWPDLTPLKVGGELSRHILIFHLFNLPTSYPKHGKYETNVKIDDSHKSQIPVVIVADPRQ